ncbi:hypothetical protein ACRRTK_002808 [Alexandromys fortis]
MSGVGIAGALEPLSPSSAGHISLSVKSFGTDGFVKHAGPTPDKLNIYDFETLYDKIYHDLLKKDRAFYTQNGIVHMQDRNRGIMSGPEQVQNSKDIFDVTFTCEEHVYD